MYIRDYVYTWDVRLWVRVFIIIAFLFRRNLTEVSLLRVLAENRLTFTVIFCINDPETKSKHTSPKFSLKRKTDNATEFDIKPKKQLHCSLLVNVS